MNHVYLMIIMMSPLNASDPGFNVDMSGYRAIKAENLAQCFQARDAWVKDMKEIDSPGIALCASYGYELDLSKPIGTETILAGRIYRSKEE